LSSDPSLIAITAVPIDKSCKDSFATRSKFDEYKCFNKISVLSCNASLIFLSPVILIVISFLGSRIEKKWTQFYGYEEPTISNLCIIFALDILIFYGLVVIVTNYIAITPIIIIFIFIGSIIITVVITKFIEIVYNKFQGFRRDLIYRIRHQNQKII
jgi:hypothetical protein